MFITEPSCGLDFKMTEICHHEMICIDGVPVLKRHFGGAALVSGLTTFCTGVVDQIDHKIMSDFNPPSTIDRNSL